MACHKKVIAVAIAHAASIRTDADVVAAPFPCMSETECMFKCLTGNSVMESIMCFAHGISAPLSATEQSCPVA